MAQKLLGTDQKLHTLIKQPTNSTIATILTDFDASEASEVTMPGWVGHSLKGLPAKAFSLNDLKENYNKLKVFPWNGRYVIIFLPLP